MIASIVRIFSLYMQAYAVVALYDPRFFLSVL